MSLLWRNTHCRERREIEEYSSLEVTDSDNNSIKESVEFSELFSERILESVGSRFEIRVAEFSLLVGSHFELELQRSHFRMQKKELVLLFCLLCVKREKKSAIYSAPAVSCQPLRNFGSDPDGGAGAIRCNPYIPRRSGSK